jgi:hypothetical protein
VRRFLLALGHPNHVLAGIEIPQCGRFLIELVAEDDHELSTGSAHRDYPLTESVRGAGQVAKT